MVKYLGQEIHVVPLTAPVNKTATFSTPFVSLKQYSKVEFVVALGAFATADIVLTVSASAVTGGTSPTAIPFTYRLSAAAGTDTMGAATACGVSGLTLAHATEDNKILLVDVEGSELTADKPYVGLTFTTTTTACVIGVVALLGPRYPQASQVNALA